MKKKLIIIILSVILAAGSATGIIIATRHRHEYNSQITQPTCTEKGYTTYTCECGDTYVDDYIDELNHDELVHQAQEPTCDDIGWEEYVTCKREGCNYSTYVEIPATGILFNTLSIDGTKVYGKVSNTTTEFSFIDEVTVKGSATYVVDNDKDCSSPIASKTVDLLVGDNIFYVLESVGNNVKLYTVTIRRRPVYDVIFETNGGNNVEKQIVEEDSFAIQPTVNKLGYTLIGWDYDFDTPITKNITITASWEANTDTKYTVNYYWQNIENDEYSLYETIELSGTTNTTALAQIVEYEHLIYNDNIGTIEGNINPDGSLVLDVYYTRDTYQITTAINNEKAGVATVVNGFYRYEKEFTVTATTNAGYTFLGWYNGDTLVCEDLEFTFKTEKDVIYTATWSANTDTKYAVNYYWQNIENDEYTLRETIELAGTTDTTATAEIKEYNHFTPVKQTVTGNINGDGDLVLDVYYTRDTYQITTAINNEKAGVATVVDGFYRYEKEFTVTATTNAGYTFLGWYNGNTLVCEDLEFTFYAKEDVVYVATWSANTDTKYTVNYYWQNIDNDEYSLKETKILTGTTDTEATAEIKDYTYLNYDENISTISGNINGEGSLVLDVYYTRKNYRIVVNGSNEKAGTNTQINDSYRYEKEFTVTATTNAGYTFLGWYEGDILVCEDLEFTFYAKEDVVYTAAWVANTDTKYTVNYYWQNVDDDNYTLKETVSKTGTTDTTATAEIKEYNHFTPVKQTVSGNINGDGGLVLEVYYTRDTHQVATVISDEKAGTVIGSGEYRYDKQITLTALTNAGYTFLGWYEGENVVCETEEFVLTVQEDVVYTAKWFTHIDTKYTTKYYLQNIDENSYTMYEFVELTGTTDTIVNAQIKTYNHFTYNEELSNIVGNIDGNGKLVLNVYYTRDTYTITANRNNTKAGTITGSGTYPYDKQITLSATTNAGYAFLGWYEGENLVCESLNYIFNATKNISYTAKWSANENTKYTVRYHLQNVNDGNYTLHETIALTGTTDTTVTAEVKTYENFTYNANESAVSGVINGNGTLILNIYYTRNSYTITTNKNIAKAGTVTDGGLYRFEKVITLKATSNAGYTFLGWYDGTTFVGNSTTLTCIVEKDVEYTAKWKANENTPYIVEYYLQNLENNNYTLYETDELTGTTDTTTIATIKSYSHFSYTANASTITGNINGNGSLVLKVYYTRNSYTVTSSRNNTNAGTVTAGGTYRYEKQISLKATTKEGYTFLGWFDGETLVCQSENFTLKVNKTAEYTAKWKANTNTPYTVNYYLQNLNDTNYTLFETYELTGTTDTTATAVIKEYQHFTYNASKSKISGNLHGNGSLVLSVYYTRDNYTIAVDVNNTKAGTVSGSGTYPFGKQVTLTATTNAGYTFLGWYDGETFINDSTTLIFTAENNVAYTTKWFTHTDTKYTVIYYLENLEDDNYTVYETDELSGETDTMVRTVIKEYQHFTYNANKSTLSGNLHGNGSLVLNVYYTRNTYTLSINDSSIGSITNAGTYKYGQEISATATTRGLGCEFIGWYCGEELLSVELTYIFIATQNVTTKFAIKAEMSDFNFTSTTTTCSITGIKDKTITKIVVPDYVTSISEGAFNGCSNLVEIALPFVGATKNDTSNAYFGYVFGSTNSLFNVASVPKSLKKIDITSASSIGSHAFYGCSSLTSVTIGNSATTIGSYAFCNCDSLTSVVIGDSVTSIGSYAFYNCYKLVEVINKSSHITISKGSSSNGYVGYYALSVFNNDNSYVSKLSTDENGYIVYTDGTEKILVGYSGIETDSILPSNITKINKYAFCNCDNLTSVVIPDSVTSIGSSAFAYCNSLTSVVIGDSVTSIGSSAFSDCINLTSVVIPDSVTSIGSSAFYNCSSLTSVVIGGSVTSIGEYAFAWCSRLTSIKYRGSYSQWNAISKDSYWNYNTESYTITYNYQG